MAVEVNKEYLLGEFSLDPDKRELRKGSRELHLARRPFQVLLYLVEHHDRVVTRNELLDRFWQGRDVYDETLTKCIGAIRKALDDRLDSPRFIETRYAEGYRYVGPLEDRFFTAGVSAVEIEKTRGVKVVIEEEEIQEAAQANEQAQPVQVPARTLSLSARKSSRRAITTLALALIVIVLAVGALVNYRTRARPVADSGASRPALAPINSIAVLPLRNLSGDPAQEYFSDGLTEGFITELSKVKGLKVISRSSAFTFKGKEIDPREVGQKLGVAAILEGSVLKSGDNVRVEVRLVSTEDGRVLWVGNTYNGALKNIFRIQDEIARSVTSGLKLELNGEGEQRLARRDTDSTEAYQAYLKGLYYLNQRTGEGMQKGIEYFAQATKDDPRYALAYTELADCYLGGIWYVPFEPKEATAKAKAAALKALELDPSLGEAHAMLSGIYGAELDWAKAKQEIELAINLNPNSAYVRHAYALRLNLVKQPDEAIAEIKRAQELDPLSLVINTDVGLSYYYARRYDEAIVAYKKALELEPNFAEAHWYLGIVYLQLARHGEAIEEIHKAIALSERTPDLVSWLGAAYASAGQKRQAQQALDELSDMSKRRYVSPYTKARIFTALGQKDETFAWLEKSYQERSIYLVNILVEPALDPLRSDPRFADLLRRVGPPE